jgi:hypothetical protein
VFSPASRINKETKYDHVGTLNEIAVWQILFWAHAQLTDTAVQKKQHTGLRIQSKRVVVDEIQVIRAKNDIILDLGAGLSLSVTVAMHQSAPRLSKCTRCQGRRTSICSLFVPLYFLVFLLPRHLGTRLRQDSSPI